MYRVQAVYGVCKERFRYGGGYAILWCGKAEK